MKKLALSLGSVLVATAFAPEASAIPAFARQTGQACSACHMQHFPVLNPTGQEFKAGGYTQMSAKGKIKGDDISIPDQLNAAVLLKARYQKTNGTDAAGTVSGTTTNGGQWQIPDELSLFFGGRVADGEKIKIGMMMENNLVGGPLGGIIAGIKVPVVASLDPVKVMVIPYLTDSLGQAYGYDQASTGITRGVRWAEHRKDISAAQYTGVGQGAASGLALVVHNDMGYINLSRWAPHFAYAGGTNAVQMSSTWLRVAATPTIADWAMHIGLGVASGSNYCNGNGTSPVESDKCDTKGNVFDIQAQGMIAERETSFYFQTSTAPKSSATMSNLFNSSTVADLKATTIGVDYSLIPHTLHVGLAYRAGKTAGTEAVAATAATPAVQGSFNADGTTTPGQVAVAATPGSAQVGSKSDNAVTVTAVYDLFQNVALHANFSKYSGEAYTGNSNNSLLTLMLEAAW